MSGRRAVVTGGSGFLGSHLCERLLLDGYDVICIDNLSTGVLSNVAHLSELGPFRMMHADVTNLIQIDGAVDAVLHFASPASPADYLRMPIETLEAGSRGTHHALGLARAKSARFLLASTSEVYGDPLVHPQTEQYWGNVNPVGPRGVYDEAKRFAEALTMAYRRHHGVDTGIIRIFNTHGPKMRITDGRVVPTLIRQALMEETLTITGDGTQTRSFQYADDLVEATVRMLACGHPGPLNVGNPSEVSMLELAEIIKSLVGSKSSVRFIDRPEGDPAMRCPDVTLTRDVLDWKPQVSLEDGLKRTIEWFREDRVVS